MRKQVCQHTGVWPHAPIDLITMPREAGYCFNPICVYLCWKDDTRSSVEYVVTEVSNTPWNQRTVHVLPVSEGVEVNGELHIERVKSLHVSPFNAEPDGEATWVSLQYFGYWNYPSNSLCPAIALPLSTATRQTILEGLALLTGG